MIHAEFDDGVVLSFPDGTADEEVDRLAKAFAEARNGMTGAEMIARAVEKAADRIVAAQLEPRQLVKDGMPENVFSVPKKKVLQ